MRGQSLQLDFADWRCQAEVYRLGFISGYFTKDEVITWADSVIALEDQPESILLDISLGRRLKDQKLVELLETVSSESNGSFRILLGLYAKRLKNQPGSEAAVADRLYKLFADMKGFLDARPEEYEQVQEFDLSLALVEDGFYKDGMKRAAAFRTFLEQYEPLADAFLEATANQRRMYDAKTQNGHGRRRA